MIDLGHPILVDCTLRDGGYYCSWDFSSHLVNEYLWAMGAAGIDYVEIGFRSLHQKGFKGPFAFCKDEFLETLSVPAGQKLGVMINASELSSDIDQADCILDSLFPKNAADSLVSLVRIASHIEEIGAAFAAAERLKKKGYVVGVNLMQIKSCTVEQIEIAARQSESYEIDVLYFADSLGSLRPADVCEIISLLRANCTSSLGIHTHDNLGLALSNTLMAHRQGVKWLDSTVTGMGRGPGNAKTEELLIELGLPGNQQNRSIAPLFRLVSNEFAQLKTKYKWGTNPYYFLAGKYGIHPSFVQEMLGDSRYEEAEIISALDQLRLQGSKKFNFDVLGTTRQLIHGEPRGTWDPRESLNGKDLLILASGPEAKRHINAIESFISSNNPVVLALNTQSLIAEKLINLRIACHPVRLLADLDVLSSKPQPIITPSSMLPKNLSSKLSEQTVFDFGLEVKTQCFVAYETFCVIPSPLVLAYALAVAAAGNVKRIMMVGFDGYHPGDPRNEEVEQTLSCFRANFRNLDLISLTPTSYKGLSPHSIYNFS